jgi:group I intron endonuclease
VIAVYAITCEATGKRYVGGTTRVKRRWRYDHCWELRAGKHYNRRLQRDWDRYGEGAFTFEVLRPRLSCDKQRLQASEQYYIDRLDTVWPRGYNARWATRAHPQVTLTAQERKSLRGRWAGVDPGL